MSRWTSNDAVSMKTRPQTEHPHSTVFGAKLKRYLTAKIHLIQREGHHWLLSVRVSNLEAQ